MAGSGSSLDRNRRRIVGGEGAFGRIKPANQHLVQPQVGRKGEPVGSVHVDGVGMRPLLALPINAGSLVLNQRGRLAQPSVWLDG